jgi:hypothetical protein
MNTPPAVSRSTTARQVGLLLAAIAALSACAPALTGPGANAMPITAAPPSATTSTATGCPPSGVAITAGPIDAAMGLRAMRIDLLNCATRPYTVRGYPAVQVLDDKRRPLDVAVIDGTAAISRIQRFDGPPQRVTAAPGERLAAVVVWRNTVADTQVPATTGRHLKVTPAAGQPAQTVTSDGGIDLGTTQRLAVSAWTTPPTS